MVIKTKLEHIFLIKFTLIILQNYFIDFNNSYLKYYGTQTELIY